MLSIAEFLKINLKKDFAEHCVKLVKQHHGLTLDKAKMLAYEFADQNEVTRIECLVVLVE